MLCHRCEYRAQYLEGESIKKGSGRGPRMECKSNWAVNSCYMYKPIKPLVIEPSDYERRLRNKTGIDRGIGGILGGRMVASKKQPEFEVIATQINKKEERYLVENKIKK